MSRTAVSLCLIAAAAALLPFAASAHPVSAPVLGDAGPPPDAGPGQCFARFRLPPPTETVMERRMVSPERRTVSVVPGACRDETKTEWVRPPSVSVVHVPAVTHVVTEEVMVRPGGWRTETLAPEYELVTEDVVVRPARREWRAARPAAFSAAPDYGDVRVSPTGEVLCLVEIPAEIQRVTRQVMRTPARTVSVPTPPVYALEQHVVVDAPAHDERKDDPGETRQSLVHICAPPRTVENIVAPTFADVPTSHVVGPAQTVWRPVTCGARPAPPPRRPHLRPCGCSRDHHGAQARSAAAPPPPSSASQPAAAAPVGDRGVRRLQEALAGKGYFHGTPDGLFTKDTVEAMTRFQHDHHLAEGRYTGETADALGL